MKTPAVEIEGLVVKYGRFTALADVTLSIQPGGFLTIIGPNGAGKTTLIKTMVGLLAPNEGFVKLLGRPARSHDAGKVSYVPQVKGFDRQFPAMTIELVVSGLRRRWPWRINANERARAITVMEKMQVAGLAEKPVSELSGGQLQRVYLARGLVREPELIIFDEPATGIDAPGEAKLYLLLEDYQKETGATVVMITHDWTVARHHATDVLLLNRIPIACGAPGVVLAEENLRTAFGHAGHRHPMTFGGSV